MIGNLVLKILEVFFICFGMVSIFHAISEAVLNRYCVQNVKDFNVLYIPEKQQTLEADVRCAIAKSISQRRILVIIHEELPEEETFILWRLCDHYEHIFIARTKDAQEVFLKAQNAIKNGFPSADGAAAK